MQLFTEAQRVEPHGRARSDAFKRTAALEELQMAHRVARQLKGRAPDVPPALGPELFDLLCEMRLQLAAQQKQHAQLRQEMAAEVSSLWRAVLSGQAGTGKLADVVRACILRVDTRAYSGR